MEDSSEDEREMLLEVRKKSFVPRGPTTMFELASVRNSGQKLPIQFNEHGQPVGATSKKMQSYIGVCVRQQIPITYNSWKEVSNELKDKIYDCISDELVATHKNEDILTDALGSKEHGGCVRGVGGFVSQSQYFNTVKGKEKMITPQVEICHKEEDDSRCKSDKKRSNRSRSSIESINIDLDADEDTPSNKGVEGTPCQLPIGSINNIVVVAMIIDDNIGCPNVKVLVDVVTGENLTIPNPEHSTRKDVVYSSNYTDVNETIKLLNRHVVKNMKDVDMIRIPMNELIFGSDKFVYLAREDLLHYCDMVEIGYMCILVYITVEDMTSETRSTTLSINSKMKNCKGCGYYVHKYIHEIVHNSSTSITSLGRTLKVLELNPFLSVHVHFQWFLTPDERSPLIESIGHLLDRFGLHLSSPSNELASRPIPWKNLSGSMPGVWVEFIGVRAPKIERLMTNTK
ncbi:transposase [Cucumis melo var. makuwa]|uniref:Transposase n=1 Tax=Cucumis melo var. makuwa TaxID=1194695 RepID=A0A5A7T267_CUCMM|nr:transposase [Cucumis melo var. makuwa]